jgi:biopolymer transport protein ExbB
MTGPHPYRLLAPTLIALGLGALPAGAQQPAATVASLDDLLDQVRNVREEENRKRAEWEQQFRSANAAQQATLLRDAEARRQAVQATADQLSDRYSNNEVRINEVNRELVEKANSLGLAELFGLARQTAGEAAVVLQQSLLTTQFPNALGEGGRDRFLREFSTGRSVPSPAELERLWLELQAEMTAQGKVTRYTAPVVQPSGESVDSEVIAIGPFSATSNGQFLAYLPVLGALNVLPRQLPGEFMAVGAEFEETQSGYARAVVDQTRGVLLGLYVERPTLIERVELGETIGYVIIIVGAVGVVLFIIQLLSLIRVRVAIRKQLKNLDQPRADNPLGRVLLAFKGSGQNIEEDADVAELRISEAVLHEVPKLERSQAYLRLAVAAGPLLGLIGTVWGMILTFQSITETGSSDPKLMATGIGQAMIATVLGLGIAIPLLFANALLNSLSRTVVQMLDEQSAGILAESIERRRRRA